MINLYKVLFTSIDRPEKQSIWIKVKYSGLSKFVGQRNKCGSCIFKRISLSWSGNLNVSLHEL